MNRTVAATLWVVLQAVAGIVAGAAFWTVVQIALAYIGHWLVNALVLTPLVAAAIAAALHLRARRFAVFGWAFFAGATVYGYLFSLLVLVHI
ncbi:hypothetical protein [Nocardia sp. CA-290969]|uniref:hypothetical protein n=1 Tax=Nocardia sp. CA-290969 TaxID=3239986 RepID=UPI003D8BE169